MFRKTKLKLTLLNACVFIMILIAFSALIYLFVRHQQIQRVDSSLSSYSNKSKVSVLYTMPKQSLTGESAPPKLPNLIKVTDGLMDPRIFQLIWSDDGTLLESSPGMQLEAGDVHAFYSPGREAGFSTVTINGNMYRVFTNPLHKPAGQSIGYSQYVMNIEPELGLLNNLLYILIGGVALGASIIVLAGMFLAERALVPVRSAWEQQQRFVADASHELRTPLSVIQANAELLLRHPADTIEAQSMTISAVIKESKRLGKLVSSLLTLARSDSGQLELQRKPVKLNRTVTDVVRKFESIAEFKQIRLSGSPCEDAEVDLLGDEERLTQLLVILLDNAIKFTPEAGVVRVDCSKKGDMAQLEVADTGVGISGQDMPFVFDRFYRGNKARTRSDGGAGLGLSIAKWIVDQHGGTIQIDSKPGEGTNVRVTLPLSRTA